MSKRIACAALRKGDAVYTVPPPGRHHHIFAKHCVTRPDGIVVSSIVDAEQGFVTDDGRFVDRKEAMKIAQDAGQVVQYSGPSDTLFTEDMW